MLKQNASRFSALLISLALILSCLCVPVAGAADHSDDYALIRGRIRDFAVGGEYNAQDERLAPILESINSTAQKNWETMNQNPACNTTNGQYTSLTDPQYADDYLWAAYPLGNRTSGGNESDNIQFTFQNLKAMAIAYKTEGCALYGNQNLLTDIKEAVEYLYANHFNKNISSYDNWYTWQLGVPLNLGELLVILFDEYTDEQIGTYAQMLPHYLGSKVMTGANEAWAERVRMYAGLLLEDPTWLAYVPKNLPALLTYTAAGDGYYTDGGFIQHDNIAYTGGYGASALRDIVYIISVLDGTYWEIPSNNVDIIYEWIENAYIPIIYDGQLMDTFRGREITRKTTSQANACITVTTAILMLAEASDEENALWMKGVVKGWFENDFMQQQLITQSGVPLLTAARIYTVLGDDSIRALYTENGTVQLNSIARTVHHAEDFSLAISMTSKRIKSAELYGTDNARGWYIGNGATWLYNADREKYEGVYKATIDWYHIPGATASSNKSQTGSLNANSFVGGVENGLYGATGMDFSVSANNLKMKKSWFMFDDEVVYMGSGISGTGTIDTTLENMILASGNRAFTANGKNYTISLNGNELNYRDITYLHLNGNVEGADVGFYFPEATNLSIKSETRTGTWNSAGSSNKDDTIQTADYLTVWQRHGTDPTDAGYAYVLLPGMSAAETENYAAGSDVEILRQDNTVHAVYEKTTGTLGACFWNGGTLAFGGDADYLNVDQPAAVMIEEKEDGIHISLSDPTQENNEGVILEMGRAVMGAAKLDEGVELLATYPTLKLKFNVQGTAGASLDAHLSFDTVTPLEEAKPQTAVNLAIGKTATTSAMDSTTPDLTPDKAVDGSTATRFSTARTDNEWFTVDLGKTARIEKIRILWETAAGKEYKVQVSDDNANWTDMVHETAGSTGWKEYTLSKAYSGRYVRMLGITRATKYGYSMYEFEVWGKWGSAGSDAPITAITLPEKLTMVQGERQTLSPTLTPADSAAGIGWKTSDEALLKINAAGLAVAMADVGEVTVTAYSLADESISATCTVTLTPNTAMPIPLTGITIENMTQALVIGESYPLRATAAPVDATYTAVRWYSSDPSVATVNADGVVTPLTEGSVTITAQSVTSDHTATVTLTVKTAEDPAPTGDVDASGVVDVADIMKLKALIMADQWSETELAIGDMDDSNALDVGDIMAVKNIIMSK